MPGENWYFPEMKHHVSQNDFNYDVFNKMEQLIPNLSDPSADLRNDTILNTEKPGCIRQLSNDERLFLWCPFGIVTVTARIYGDVIAKELIRAIHMVRIIHPLIGSRIIIDEENNAWYTTDNVPDNQVRIVSRISDTQWIDEISKEQGIIFRPEEGPMIRFVLVHSPDISELIIMAAHTIGDGMALANLFRDILVCYADPDRELEVRYPPIIDDYLPLDSGFSIKKMVGRYFANKCNKRWRENPYSFSQEDMEAMHSTFFEKYRNKFLILHLDQNGTSDLLLRCRENEVTITSAVTTACIAAHDEVMGPFPKKRSNVSIAFDLRRRLTLPNEDIFCHFASGFQVPFRYQQKKPFWINVRKIHVRINKRLKRVDTEAIRFFNRFDRTLIDALFNYGFQIPFLPEAFNRTENLASFMKDEKNVARTIGKKISVNISGTTSTNLGRLDYPVAYGNLTLGGFYFIPSIGGDMLPLLLGGVGFDGTVTFTLNYAERIDGTGITTTEKMTMIQKRALEILNGRNYVS